MSSSCTKSVISMVRDRSGSAEASSSGARITKSPPPTSAPLTMRDDSTSSPVRSLTFLYRIRSEVPSSNWLKWIVLSLVAGYRPTGTLTRPKLSDPFQIVRATPLVLPRSGAIHHPVTPIRQTGPMPFGAVLTDADRAVGLTRGIATLIPDDLSTGNLGIELGLSLWMQRADLPLSDACAILLTVRDALVETSGLDSDR